jgi:hypothetical protein
MKVKSAAGAKYRIVRGLTARLSLSLSSARKRARLLLRTERARYQECMRAQSG